MITAQYFGDVDRRTLTEGEKNLLRCADAMAEDLLLAESLKDKLLKQHKVRVGLDDRAALPGWAVRIIQEAQ